MTLRPIGKHRFTSKILYCLLAFFFCYQTGVLQAQVTSNFSTNNEGWTIFDNNSGSSVSATYNSTGGNPGGNISFGTTTGSAAFYWTAPVKFNGNFSRSYGQNLTFQLQQDQPGTDNSMGDLIITSGTSKLYYQLPSKPANGSWSSYSVQLKETFSGWHYGSFSGPTPTRDQFKTVLGNITNLQIRLKYFTTNTFTVTGSLDNVVLNVAALASPPTISSFSPKSGIGGITSLTINGTNFNATASNNAVFFGGVKASITFASTTKLIVTVPVGAQNSPIVVENTSLGLSASTIESFTPLFDNNKDYGGQIIRASLGKPVGFNVAVNGNKGTIAVGDIDGDGFNDLITGEGAGGFSGAQQFTVYRNSGQSGTISASTFSSKVSITSAKPYSKGYIAVADFDGDGKLDVVLSSADNSYAYISVYRNTSTPGSISFAAESNWLSYSYSDGPLVAADIDGDGRPEILGVFNNNCASGDRLYIYQNLSTTGAIDFAAIQTFSSVYTCGGNITVGDLTGDKLNDVAVTSGTGGVTIFRNTSTTGTLSMAPAFQITSNSAGNAIISDLDADGLCDVAWPYSSAQDVIIRKNNYAGGTFDVNSFSSDIVITSPLTGTMNELTSGDFNGDNKIDLLLTSTTDMVIFENVTSAGTLNTNSFVEGVPFAISSAATNPTCPVFADFDQDNKQDVLIRLTSGSNVGAIQLYHNESYPVPKINSLSPTSGSVTTTVTLTGDRMKTGGGSPTVRLSGITTTTTPVDNLTTKAAPVTGSQSGKFIMTEHGLSSESKPFSLLFNTDRIITPTAFGPVIDYALSTNTRDALSIGDFNNDSKPDVAVVDNFSTTKVFQNSATVGQSISATTLTLQGTTYTAGYNLLALDIDGDGKIDLHNGYGLLQNNSSSAISFLSGPNGIYTSSGGFTQVAPADFNNDGKMDMAQVNGTASIQVYENQSDADVFVNNSYLSTFKYSPISLSKPNANGGVVAEDFDGDGYTDIISTNQTAGNMTFYLNTKSYGPITSSSFSFLGNYSASGSQPIGLCASDFDGDGKIDIAITYFNSSFVSVYRNNSSLGDISFASPVDLTAAGFGYNIATQDLDGDGKAELVVIHKPSGNGSFTIFKNQSSNGSINFATGVNVSLTRSPQAINIADINLDQKPDIFIVGTNGLTAPANALMVFENKINTPIITVTSQPVNPNNRCVGLSYTFSTDAIGTTNITYQWQKYNTTALAFQNLTDGSTYSGTTTKNLLISNIQLAQDGDYRCVINGDFANTVYCNTGTLTVHALPPTPVTTDGQHCGTGQVVVSASGAADGEFVWYADGVNGEPIEFENNSTYTTPSLTTSTTFYVTIVNSFCETARVPVNANIINAVAPSTSGASLCTSGSTSLAASGGANGQYRWYTSASGNTIIAGEQNSTYTTPVLLATATYYVSLVNGTCESSRTPVTLTIGSPAAPTTTDANRCGTGSVTLSASGGTNGQYRWYTNSSGGSAIAGETNSSFTTPSTATTTTYYVSINSGSCESSRTAVTATINTLPDAPTTSGASQCGNGSVTLNAAGGTNGQYRWYSVSSGGTAIAGETNNSLTTPSISSTTTYYVSIDNGTCEGARTAVTATINTSPVAPITSAGSRCGIGSLTLNASGGTNGQYRWYTNSSGGSAIAGETNSSFATPSISTTTTYYVSINNGTCESSRSAVIATVNSIPTKPVISSSETITSGTTAICTGPVTLSGPSGFSIYNWSTGASTSSIIVSVATNNITLKVSDANGCQSPDSDPLQVIVNSSCLNSPPVINTTSTNTTIGSSASINVTSLISDPDNNLDLASLRIKTQPKSGAVATLNGQTLSINYSGIKFSGQDELTIEVCYLEGACTQQKIIIEVIGDVIVYNAISNNGDDKNAKFIIQYIDAIDATRSNKVSIFNRWGDIVWEAANYDNTNVVFTGQNKHGEDLPSATYFYKVEFNSSHPSLMGYLTIKR